MTPPSRCWRCSAAPPTRTPRSPAWSGCAEVVDDPAALLGALVDDEGTAMRLLCVLGASEALADHLVRHPEHWRELTDPALGLDPAGGVGDARRRCCAAVGADPDDAAPVATRARRARPWTRCGWSTAGCCCGSPPAT